MKRWTSQEDAVLLKYHARLKSVLKRDDALEKLKALLPGRSRQMIFYRARKIGLRAKTRWTPEEDAVLRLKWAEGASGTIRKMLPGRSWNQIQARADRLGLEGRWQGFVAISDAADRMGFHLSTFTRIAEDMGVSVYSRVSRNTGGSSRGKHRVVELDDVVEAVSRWLAMETARSASERTGVPESTIKAWIKSEGLSKGSGVQVRMSKEDVDSLIEKHRAVWEKRRRDNG